MSLFQMRNYKRKLGSRKYKDFSPEVLQEAIDACHDGMSARQASQKYGIPRATLNRKLKGLCGHHGHPTALSKEEETQICEYVVLMADWGFPMSKADLRHFVKDYIERKGITVPEFVENLPGNDWAEGFLKRHKEEISVRSANNIKRARAEVGPDVIRKYFQNLASSIENVAPSHIFNYDETNLSDDPGRKQVLAKRGMKYVDRVQNNTKSSISVMFCASADGIVLPPYIVYKAEHLWSTWCSGGPKGTRFNRSKSGWFESPHFLDWFKTIFLPFSKKLDGTKILIGDNLSTHFCPDVLKMASDNNIKFVCLPPNSTHLCQPLDVSFFGPMKRVWREILDEHKRQNRKSTTLAKEVFPALLDQLMEKVFQTSNQNIKSGFKACGIVPLNPNEVLKKLPDYREDQVNRSETSLDSSAMADSVLSVLKEIRYEKKSRRPAMKRRKLEVEPGKSISLAKSSSDDENTQPCTSRQVIR